MSLAIRGLLTVAAFAASWVFNTMLSVESTLTLGAAAGQQFALSDSAYAKTMYTFGAFHAVNVLAGLALLIALVAIWWVPAKKLITTALTATLMLVAAGTVLTPSKAYAYYDKADWPEVYMIMPNETAFWVPDVGNNKDSQVQMDSEAYYNAAKVQSLRFTIPHVKWVGSGNLSDFYVPGGRLIVVDRTPYSRMWVDAHDRGTSKDKQGYVCQTREGLNITTGVAIGVNVAPANAAKFLYYFGVLPPKGVRTEPATIFTSVYQGRSLEQVMDDVGRMKIHTLVCNEVGKKSFNEANRDMVPIMEKVEKDAKAYFDSVGITLSFIGWGDTFNFDAEIQTAINSRYITEQDAANYALLATYASDIKTYALAGMIKSSKLADYKGPQVIMGMDPSVLGMLGTMLNTPAVAPAARPGPTAAPVK